jgi:hypothetical protein
VKLTDKAIDWDRYPKLAGIFQERPRVNVYWQELERFVEDHGGTGHLLTATPTEPPRVPKDEVLEEAARVADAMATRHRASAEKLAEAGWG